MNTTFLPEDGVHISNEGYKVWSRAVEEIINRKMQVLVSHKVCISELRILSKSH